MNKRLRAMREGGHRLAKIKDQLVKHAQPGVRLEDLDQLALELILQARGKPSFKMVPGYRWSTCINLNHGVVHGIPHGTLEPNDLVTVDVGMYFKGFHTDTSTSFYLDTPPDDIANFIDTGRRTLSQAIAQATPGNRVWDISAAIEANIQQAGYSVITALTGHGVGKILHDEPAIPCFTNGSREQSPLLKPGQTLAIEVMYAQRNGATKTNDDNWTIETNDGSLAAVFEETIIVSNPPEVLTSFSS